MIPREKAILLTTLGTLYPKQKNTCFPLARKLNFNTSFPHLFLKSILNQKESPQNEHP